MNYDTIRLEDADAVHKEAERLRALTDSQLVVDFYRAVEEKAAKMTPQSAQKSANGDKTERDTSDVERLLNALAEGKCKGIKSGFAYKVAQLAKEMGLIE